MNGNIASYFDSFGVKHTPKENKNIRLSKNLIANICRRQTYNSIMRGYF